MRQFTVNAHCSRFNFRAARAGGARIILLVATCFLLGAAVSAFWFYTRARSGAGQGGGLFGRGSVVLSPSTRQVLEKLSSPVRLRFYFILDPATVGPEVKEFAGRVDELLAAYQAAGAGKVELTRVDATAPNAADAASADGLRPFNLDKGDACYLGVAIVAANGQKEALPQLALDWEPALESDLTRAIVRVTTVAPPKVAAQAARADAATVDAVKQAIPNLATVSLEEGTRLLREAALKEFRAAATDSQAQVQEAQQRLARAQSGGSDAEKQDAMKHLQEVQTAQAEKIKEIAARSQAQVDALRQLKSPQ